MDAEDDELAAELAHHLVHGTPQLAVKRTANLDPSVVLAALGGVPEDFDASVSSNR